MVNGSHLMINVIVNNNKIYFSQQLFTSRDLRAVPYLTQS